ncbi:hypothetical protein, partial [Aquiflexum sp.]|uniref:hypothetical protein n=1 Tax=Aquiflexum sp. TaxID=1872584 RepID=UPI0035942B90
PPHLIQFSAPRACRGVFLGLRDWKVRGIFSGSIYVNIYNFLILVGLCSDNIIGTGLAGSIVSTK